MLTKLHIALLICLLGFQIGCKTEQTSATSIDTQPTVQKYISDEEIRKLFLEIKREENDKNLAKLKSLPKERVIAVVKEIKENGIPVKPNDIQSRNKNEYVKLRSAFYLWELDVDKDENEKYILEKAKLKTPETLYEIKYEAIALVGDFIAKGKKEYLPIVFAAVPDSNGAYAHATFGIMADEIKNSPKTFLQFLSKEPLKIRKSVYERLSHSENVYGTEEWKKLSSELEKLIDDKEVGKTAQESLKPIVSANSSKKEIREIILNEHFYEGDRTSKAIISLPKKKIVPILEELRDEGIEEGEVYGTPSKLIELKSVYLLCKLNVDYDENVQFLIDEVDPPSTSKRKEYLKTPAIEYIGQLITPKNKELLQVVFRVAPKSDAGFAQSINAILYYELSRFPKPFLQYLSKESSLNKDAVIEILKYGIETNEKKEKLKSNLTRFMDDKDLGKIAKEIAEKLN